MKEEEAQDLAAVTEQRRHSRQLPPPTRTWLARWDALEGGRTQQGLLEGEVDSRSSTQGSVKSRQRRRRGGGRVGC